MAITGLGLRQNRNLLLLFAANSISQFAQGITLLAVPWTVVEAFGAMGGPLNARMVATSTVLVIGWSLYGGTLVDRFNRKHIFLSINACAAVVLFAAGAYGYATGGLPYLLLAGVFLAAMMVYAIHFPNLYAFTQHLFQPAQYARINAAIEIQGQLTNILGMTVASVLLAGSAGWPVWPTALTIAAWPLQRIFLLNGCAYVVALLVIRSIRYTHVRNTAEHRDGIVTRLRTGLRYLFGHTDVLVFGLTAYAVFFGALILLQVLLPVFVQHVLQADASLLAFAQGALAVGAIGAAGGSILRRGGSRNPVAQVVLTLLIAMGLITLIATVPQPAVLVLGLLVYGVINATARIHRVTFIQQQVPNYVLGRVHSSLMFINYLMRAGFIYALSLPFFTGTGTSGNVVYGMLGLAVVQALAVVLLLSRYRRLVQREATAL